MYKYTPVTYPGSDDIGYAVYLKKLAVRLPAYADRYELEAIKIIKVQIVALEFIELLTLRMHRATDYIRQPHSPAATATQADVATSWCDYKALLQEFIARLVTHILQHSAYCAADGDDMGLPALI